MLDPGCGEGAFTVACAARLIRQAGPPRSAGALADCILAVEKDEAAAAAALG